MNITSTKEEKIPLSLQPVTAAGNPAAVDGIPVWEITEGDATVEVAPDGLSAFIVSGSTIGTAKYRVSADADLGEGVRTIEIVGDYTITDAGAAALGLVAGAAVLK